MTKNLAITSKILGDDWRYKYSSNRKEVKGNNDQTRHDKDINHWQRSMVTGHRKCTNKKMLEKPFPSASGSIV